MNFINSVGFNTFIWLLELAFTFVCYYVTINMAIKEYFKKEIYSDIFSFLIALNVFKIIMFGN